MRRPRAFTLVAEAADSEVLGNAPASGDARAPEGQPSLAQRFSAGAAPKSRSSPGGTTQAARTLLDARAPEIANPGIFGFIVAETRSQSGHIITIDVVAEARRLGVGSALLLAAEDRLRASGAAAVALETAVNNAAAIRFYKQKGYFVERTVRGYYSNHLDALVMRKDLTQSVGP